MPDGRLRICYALNTFDIGGAEVVTLDLARNHDPQRFDVTVVAFTEPRRERESEMRRRFREAGIATDAIHQANYRSPLAWWRIFRYLRRGRFDIILGHNRGADYWGARLGRLAGIPHLAWARHSVYTGMKDRHARRYRDLVAAGAGVVAVSETVRQACIGIEGIDPAKVETITNGIDVNRFSPLGSDGRASIRSRLGVAEDELLVLYVGRFSHPKAPEAFVSLVRRLRDSEPRVRGFMCGYGPLEDAVRGAAAAADGAVEVLGLCSDVPRMLGAADLFVSTSRNEGLPLNVMEAMACGTAFVAPSLSQVEELAAGSPELRAQLYRPPPESEVPAALIEEWVETALATLHDAERRRAVGDVARKIISDRFSVQTMVAGYERFLERLVASNA